MDFTEFLPRVLPWAKNCPEQTALQHVIDAARAFCARTLVWNYTCRTIKTATLNGVGITDYTLQIGAQEDLVRLLACEVNQTEYEVPRGVSGRAAARRGSGNFCTMLNLDDFRLSPAPAFADLDIIIDVAVKPKVSATVWPDDMAEYMPDIAHGALATLLDIPDTTWRDERKAETERIRFEDRVCTVQWKVNLGFGSSKPRRQGSFY